MIAFIFLLSIFIFLFYFNSKNKKRKQTKPTKNDYGLAELKQKEKEADNEIKILLKADERYEKDNDLQRIIDTYEKIVTKKTNWQCYNFRYKLIQYYLEAKLYSKAWAFSNQMMILEESPDIYKIRLLQFEILKQEGKFKHAFVFLSLCSYLNKYDTSKWFLNKAKPLTRKLGIPVNDLEKYSEGLLSLIKRKNVKETDVKQYANDFLKNY